LIINADDFGLTAGVNRAIAEAHRQGIVTSATLMAHSNKFTEAVRLAGKYPRLSVGCHVVLVDGFPVMQPSAVPTLLGSNDSDASFENSLGRFAARVVSGRIDSDQIEAEATAQIRKLQAAGLVVTHFDTHKHTHMFPGVLRALLRAARACGVRALRNPFVPHLPGAARLLRQRPELWKRYLQVRVLRWLDSGFHRAVRAAGLATPAGSFGVVSTGALDMALFEAILDCIPEGTWEFVCHPGYNDSELAGVHTRLRDSRAKELEVLTSKEARKAVSRRGIELISYHELVGVVHH
jgi:chitin disaccharide deacetylase